MRRYDFLVDLLSFKAVASDNFGRLRASRIGWMARQLPGALFEGLDAGDKDALVATWSSLSLEGAGRFLRAPAVCQAVRTGMGPRVLRLHLMAEHLLDNRQSARLERWSALGDVWLGGSPPQYEDCISPQAAAGLYYSPRLACGIPIDLSLDAAPAFPGAGVPRPTKPDSGQTRHSVARLNHAIAVVERACKPALDLVLGSIENVILRKDEHESHRLRSASSAAALGRVLLVNADTDANSEALLADALVHEAIHTLISTIELDDPFMNSDRDLAAEFITSPWTGSALPVHAFLHACVVWYGLLHFWAKINRLPEHSDEATSRVVSIKAGFASLNCEALNLYITALNPSVVPMLYALQNGALAL